MSWHMMNDAGKTRFRLLHIMILPARIPQEFAVMVSVGNYRNDTDQHNIWAYLAAGRSFVSD
eukprot:1551208-Rhodomonas_salina.1